MRRAASLFSFVALVLVIGSVAGQSARPQFRPAVLGSGPDSLINRIDAKALAKTGQKDGAVMFAAVVAKTGEVVQSQVYRPTPGTGALEEEVRKRLVDLKVAPAIYNHQPVDVILSGTVVFSMQDETPKVRIFLNQDPNELKAAADFIAPQPVFGGDSHFTGIGYPDGVAVPVKAVVDLRLVVDAEGRLQDLRVLAEEPPLLNFGATATKDFAGAKFIPAFRDGDRTNSDVIMPVSYQPPDWAAGVAP